MILAAQSGCQTRWKEKKPLFLVAFTAAVMPQLGDYGMAVKMVCEWAT